ncbi:MAG TPA: sensor histidine kinase [Candidatus Limnocylindrales bacterium]|jgi:signal transduction histidine kinase
MGTISRALGIEGRSGVGPIGMRRLLDASAVALGFATFARLGDFEILLQALWVLVGIGAFLYGLRGAILRIVIVAAAAVVVATVAALSGHPVEDEVFGTETLTGDIADLADVAEWPLMIGIAVIVAFLADRIATSAARYAALYRQASARLLTAHEEERGRLARDLHDGVGQTLTAIVLTLDAAEGQLWANGTAPAPLARSTIQHAQELAAAALEETRDVAAQLHPTRIREIGLGAALRNLARGAGVAVEIRLDPAILPPGLLHPDREIDAYRIVQEAIGNAARHSRAATIWIDGQVNDTEIRLEVGDDGMGFDGSVRGRGLGLSGMTERAAILGARLEVRSRQGAGTVVELAIPHAPHPERAGLADSLAPVRPLP